MENLTIEQWMEKHPYLNQMSEYTLFTTKEDIELLNSGPTISVDSRKVSIEFLKRILTNDFYFEYISRYFTNEINNFVVSAIVGGDTWGSVSYKKTTIIKAIEQLISSGQIALQVDEQKRYETLKGYVSFEKFLEKHRGNNYNVEVDNYKYSIPIENLISLMQLSNEAFDDLCSNNEIKNINEISKEHFIYAAMKFLKETSSIDEYLVPDIVIEHYKDIVVSQKIDLQALNTHLITTDTKYKDVHIDFDLEQAIIGGMPKDATNLEKAIYIYIKMCKLLTYDDEYFAVNQRGIATQKHKNIDYVSTITLDNNKVVCFEFNLIYSKLLNDLGIHFSSEYQGMLGEVYGEGHANLEFRTGKFLVSADSVTSILQGDIVRAKLNQPLVGIKCINRNVQTQQEFEDALTKMYRLIVDQEKELSETEEIEQIKTMGELLEEYYHTTKNITDISLDERLSILVYKVNSTKMVGIDSLSYILQLRNILFDEVQKRNNVKVTIVRNNVPFEEDKVAMATAVFALNDHSFIENSEQNAYYYFNPNHSLIPITKEELQAKFDEHIFCHIDKGAPRIPGIIESEEIKK